MSSRRRAACTTLLQIFRTEHHSAGLDGRSVMPLMSVVVATIAAASVLLTAAEHVPQVLAWAAHPGLGQLHPPTWQQALPVVWSALMSTDLVLLIEARSLAYLTISCVGVVQSCFTAPAVCAGARSARCQQHRCIDHLHGRACARGRACLLAAR